MDNNSQDQKHNEQNQINQNQNDQLQKDQDQLDAHALSQLKTVQTLLTIAVIAGPVSLVLGGVLLSAIAFVCAMVGYIKLKNLSNAHAIQASSSKALSDTLRRQSLVCIVVCTAVLVINAMFFVQLVSMYMDYIATGDVSGLMDALYGSSSAATSSGADSSAATSGSSSAGNSAGSGGSVWDK